MTTQTTTVDDLIPEANPLFDVVMVYVDFASVKHAIETYHRLAAQFKDEPSFRLASWTAGLLGDVTLNAIAVREAAEAKVIILAADCDGLPPAVKNWVEGWRVHKSPPRALLVAILNCPGCGGGYCDVENYLRSAAADCGREIQVEKIAAGGKWRSDSVSPDHAHEFNPDL